jgi:cytochrome c oxidase subunit 2
MDKQWNRLVGYFVATVVVSTLLVLVPNMFGGGWFPDLVSVEGGRIDDLAIGLTILSIVIFSIVAAIVIYCVVHFRVAPGDDSDGEPIHGHHTIEVIWTVIPAIIVIVVGVLSYAVLVKNEEVSAKEVDKTVFVRAYQFGWAFSYDGVALTDSDGEALKESTDLVVPVGDVTRYEVMACSGREQTGLCVERYGPPAAKTPEPNRDSDQADVNHAFWVPEARLKIDAVSGVHTWTQFTTDSETTVDQHMQVVCAELCGSGHNGMRTDFCSVSPDTFEWWTEHADVTCNVLRYFTCDVEGSYDSRYAAIETLLATDDDATCDDLEVAA